MKKRYYIIIITFILLCFIIFIYYKNIDDNETIKESQFKDSPIVSNLMDTMHYTIERRYNDDIYEGYFYNYDYIDNNNISDEIKIYLAIRTFKQSDWASYNGNMRITIREDNVKKKIKELFNTSYTNKTLNGDPCVYAMFEYDDKSHIYIQPGNTCDNELKSFYTTKIINAKDYDDYIEIDEKVGYLKFNNTNYLLYKNKNELEYVTTLKSDNIDNILDSLNTYRFKFIKQNNNYYLESVKKIG